jgi:hypothetical protein
MANVKVRSAAGKRQPVREAEAGGAMVPFVAAAHEHEELVEDKTVEITANEQNLAPMNIGAYGYARSLWIQVETVEEGTTEAEATENEDCPWKIFSSIQLNDVNGTPLFNPMNGYTMLWCNILGGYRGVPDPRQAPYYSSSMKKPKFSLRVPIEVSRKNAFGAIANQNSGAMYKLYLSINDKASLVTKYSKMPKLRIRVYLEAWSQPDDYNLAGRPQAEGPPLLDSAQYHSHYVRDTQKGANTVLLTEVGDLIRFVLIIARTGAGARSDAVMADPIEMKWDGNVMHTFTRMMQEEHLAACVPQLKERDKGVFAFLFNIGVHGTVGDDSPTLYYPTMQSTRLELIGNTAEAGSWDIVSDVVAPVAVSAAERYQVPNRSSFQPEAVGGGQVGTRVG